jgi:hypothetical protein
MTTPLARSNFTHRGELALELVSQSEVTARVRNRLNNVARLSQRSHPIEPDVPPEVAYIARQQNVPGAAPPRRAGGAVRCASRCRLGQSADATSLWASRNWSDGSAALQPVAAELACTWTIRRCIRMRPGTLTFRGSDESDVHCRPLYGESSGRAARQRPRTGGSPGVAEAGLRDRRGDSNPIEDRFVHKDHHARSHA